MNLCLLCQIPYMIGPKSYISSLSPSLCLNIWVSSFVFLVGHNLLYNISSSKDMTCDVVPHTLSGSLEKTRSQEMKRSLGI